jgi:hypothetical protein
MSDRRLTEGRRRRFELHPDTLATLAAKPEHFSPITSTSRLKSLRYALVAGCTCCATSETPHPGRRDGGGFLGLWLGLRPCWAILILTITINWMGEFINAALEAAVNLASQEIHPMARVAKDVGAAAVLLAAVAAFIIAALVLGPPLLERVGPWLLKAFIR